ncbi:MAG TPA: DUF1810 domain-containing protein [Luteimonas sp.]
MNDFNLDRFVIAQAHTYATALEELRSGRKRSHWMWFVFPQLKGLGRSAVSEEYGLRGLPETRAYLMHPLLGARLRESTQAMLGHRTLAADEILGALDAVKFRSCLTLFTHADSADPLLGSALEHFFQGEGDPRTLALLDAHGDA